MTDSATQAGNESNDSDRTYACPHCGGEMFGLVMKDGDIAYARCRLCDEVVLDG